MFGRISQLLKWGVARFADSLGARLLRPDGTALSIPYSLAFPDFSPSILASFVAGTTASQAGTTVTVTAAAHGIIGNASRNGLRIYFPGSPSIPAGWYSGFAWIDANTVTFQRPASSTVSSESVNGGLAFTSTVTVCSLTLPGSSLGALGRLTMRFARHGDATAGAKAIKLAVGATTFCTAFTTTVPAVFQALTAVLTSAARQIGVSSADGLGGSAQVVSAVDTSTDQTVSCTASLTNAAQWQAIDWVELEGVRR